MKETIEVPEQSTLYETYATFILQAYNLIELIDELKGTNMYKLELKQQLNRVLKILDTPEYYERIDASTTDWEAFANLTDHHKRFFKRLVRLSPSHWGVLAESTFRLIENPALFAAMLNINIGSSEDVDLLREKEELGGLIGVMDTENVKKVRMYIQNVLAPNMKPCVTQ